MREGPLDMRMNPDEGESAAEWLNRAQLEEISMVIRDFGEESFIFVLLAALSKRGKKSLLCQRSSWLL